MGGELLTSTEDITERWKEFLEDLLNSTDTPSAEDAGVGQSITQAEITEVVKSRVAVGVRLKHATQGRTVSVQPKE